VGLDVGTRYAPRPENHFVEFLWAVRTSNARVKFFAALVRRLFAGRRRLGWNRTERREARRWTS
jgi:hypothetical protein